MFMEKEIILDREGYRSNKTFISARELMVIEYMADGLSSKEIAEKMGITPKTVEVHRHNVMKKTEAKNAVHLIASFLRKGLIK